MADLLIFDEQEAEFLRELVRQKVEFMIVGLSAAALQGAPVVTQDVDLWFRSLSDPGIERALRKVHGSYVPPMMQNPPMFAGDAVGHYDVPVDLPLTVPPRFDLEKGRATWVRPSRGSAENGGPGCCSSPRTRFSTESAAATTWHGPGLRAG